MSLKTYICKSSALNSFIQTGSHSIIASAVFRTAISSGDTFRYSYIRSHVIAITFRFDNKEYYRTNFGRIHHNPLWPWYQDQRPSRCTHQRCRPLHKNGSMDQMNLYKGLPAHLPGTRQRLFRTWMDLSSVPHMNGLLEEPVKTLE
jgi:hypothetical protein